MLLVASSVCVDVLASDNRCTGKPRQCHQPPPLVLVGRPRFAHIAKTAGGIAAANQTDPMIQRSAGLSYFEIAIHPHRIAVPVNIGVQIARSTTADA